ncbi:MAG: hypothetical protein PHX13_07765 [Thiovulaceae bacterium]|nr:hypothetical protein [Sulfurimonadaceae bacterium]
MNKQDEKASVLLVQKHQLNQVEDKVSQVGNAISAINQEQKENEEQLDKMLLHMENLITSNNEIVYNEDYKNLHVMKTASKISYLSELEKLDIDDDISWNEYVGLAKKYAFKNNIDFDKDPFEKLMATSQKIELEKRIQEDFTFKNADCDKYDYMIAGTCGVVSGLVDILFVGAPGDSKLGNIADEQANKITEKFAEFLGWNKEKAVTKGSNTTASAIGFLEKKFKINYDQATTNGKKGTGGVIKNLSMSNHHLKSLGHSPDIIGLFFSILNQFTNTSTFINNGQIITIDTENFELKGGNFIAKIFCGFANWFGHIMSDWVGSSGAQGRGSGVPIPFYNLLQLMDFGAFGKDRQTFATITTKVFEQGYDFRHGMAMAIPVMINELLIRFMYTMKVHFYHKKDWKDSIPSADVHEVRRMLLVGHGVLCLIDGTDACIRSGNGADIVTLLGRTNLLAWVRFGQLGLKEVYVWHKSGHINVQAVDEYLAKDLQTMLR